MGLGAGAIASLAGCSALQDIESLDDTQRQRSYSLEKVGHSLLSTPGVYAEGSLSADGQYGVVGSGGGNGTFLVDIDSLSSPIELHHLPSSSQPNFHSLDVKFDPSRELYYRTLEPVNDENKGSIEVVDFGYQQGRPEAPSVISQLDVSPSHNIHPHPDQPIVYAAISQPGDNHGLAVWDVSDPFKPKELAKGWPNGGLHDIVVDTERELLHCASGKGYIILDISNPEAPTELGWFDYSENPNYTEVGTPGYESAHYASFDPRRDLAVVGDEVSKEVPGGKHIFDIGWDEGSPEDPKPIGFTHSPNAQIKTGEDHQLWTTHNHDVVPKGNQTLLVSGDYSEGVVLYDITDPTEPEPIDSYQTDVDADETHGGKEPWAWSAVYHPKRDIIFVSDRATGVYLFSLTAS